MAHENAGHSAPDAQSQLALHDPLAESFPEGRIGKLLFYIAIAFSVFQIATAAHIIDLPSQVVRALHVGFVTLLIFPLLLGRGRGSIGFQVLAWLLAGLAVAAALYQWVEYEPLIIRAGDPLPQDMVIGVIAIATVFVAAWLAMGPTLPIISGLFLAYCLFGQYLPSPFNHRGYDFSQVIDHMAFGTEGIYGIPIYVSSTYIFLFILFGAFLEKAGMIKLFTDIALGLVGDKRGGAAKVAIISSALMGTISGSGVGDQSQPGKGRRVERERGVNAV